MNCQQVERLLPLYAGRDLRAKSEQLVAAHLQSCANCSATAADYRETRNLVHEFAPPAFSQNVYADIRQNVWRRIETETRRKTIFQSIGGWFSPRLAWAVAATLLIVSPVFMFYLIRAGFNGRRDLVVNVSQPMPTGNNSSGLRNPSKPAEGRQSQPQVKIAKPPRKLDRLHAPAPANTAVAYLPRTTSAGAPASMPFIRPTDFSDPPGDSENTLRLEIQTKNPNIRIIWFAPREQKPAAVHAKGT